MNGNLAIPAFARSVGKQSGCWGAGCRRDTPEGGPLDMPSRHGGRTRTGALLLAALLASAVASPAAGAPPSVGDGAVPTPPPPGLRAPEQPSGPAATAAAAATQ